LLNPLRLVPESTYHEGSTAMSRLMTLLAALFTTANRFQRQIMA
jgi:hypothetical protein